MTTRVVLEFNNDADADRFRKEVDENGEVMVEWEQWSEFQFKTLPAQLVEE